MELFFTILILMLVVSLSGVATRMVPFQIPLPLMQIAIGALIAWMGMRVEFEPELFLVLFIPPLLFADGRKTPLKEFLHHGREIIGLALVLVLLTVVGMGYLIHWLIPDMPLFASFALAAVLSPTDAVALSGIVGKGRIPHSIMSILEGEALMNDASGLVSLKFTLKVAVGAMVFETASDYYSAGIEFFIVAVGGIVAGILVTWIYTRSLRLISRWSGDDPATQMILLLLLPFAAYVVAEHFEFSGILAAVAAGMTVGHSGVLRNAPLDMRLRANSVWTMLEFVLNGLVFIMLGLQIPFILETSMAQLDKDPTMQTWMLFADIIWIYIALLLMRFLWLWGMKLLSNRALKKRPLQFGSYTLRELLIASFAGVRGAITLAGALSIPILLNAAPFPARYQIVFLATGVILFSLLCGVLALPLLLRGLTSTDHAKLLEEQEAARLAMSKVAVESLEKLHERLESSSEENIDPHLLTEVSSKVIGSLRRYRDQFEQQEDLDRAEELERRFRLTALRAERGELYHLRATQKISNETMEKLLYDLDLSEKILTGNG
jgi:Na+/H+ antiporter